MRISDWSSDVCSSDLFGASGFEVIGSVHGEFEVQIEVQSTVTVVGCGGCGTRAVAKDRRWVTVRDAPAGHLAGVVRWRKRSEERRVGKEFGSTCSSRGSPDP